MNGFAASKAQKVYLMLKARILNGDFASGRPLPGEQSISDDHEVSRITLRRALAQLESEGLIYRKQGVGTFATPRFAAKPIVSDFADLLAALTAMGKQTTVSVREFTYLAPSTEVREALKLAGDARAQYSVRVRFIEGQPFSYLRTHVPERIGRNFTACELEAHPLLTLLERSGVVVASATQSFSATLASPEIAAALDVSVGSALISLTRTVFDENAAGVEHLEALYRPDRYTFQMQLARDRDNTGLKWSPASTSAKTH